MAKSKPRDTKRQSRLTFSPLPSSSPAKASQPEATRNRAAAVIIEGPVGSRKKRQIEEAPQILTPTISSSQIESPSRRLTRSFMTSQSGRFAGRPRKRVRSLIESESSDSELESATPEKSNIGVTSNGFQGDSESDTPFPPPRKPASPRTSDAALTDDRQSLDGSDESDVVILQSASKRRIARTTAIDTMSSDDDEIPMSSVRRHIKRGRSANARGDLRSDGLTSNSEHENDTGRRLSLQKAPISRSTGSPGAASADSEQRDLQSDLEFLRDVSPEAAGRTHLASAEEKKSAKHKALDALRQRRASSKNSSSQTLPLSGEGEPGNQTASERSSDYDQTAYEEDVVDDEWVVEDDGRDLEEAQAQLPFAMRLGMRKPKDLFKYAVEWMVHKKLNPAFNSGDEVYDVSFRKLDDYVAGLGGSKFQSSAWTSEFRRSLRGRPIMEDGQIVNSAILNDKCDACNRSGHPATWEIRFVGSTYDRDSLEDDDEDEDESDDLHGGRDHSLPEGVVPSQSTTYYVGKFCRRNARISHALHHWKRHLLDFVSDYLEVVGLFAADQIVRRDRMSMKKRSKLANSIVDQMEANGEVKRLYRMFKNEIDSAQNQDSTGRLIFSSD